jgi:hypothetical protein
MPRVRFIGGHYDGADFVFADRLPEQVELTFDCIGGDMNDASFREALEANLTPDEREGLVTIRNAQSIRYTYKLESGSEGEPYYRYASWAVVGVDGG